LSPSILAPILLGLALHRRRGRVLALETGETVKARRQPIVVITSNNEKELPDAFLRRCFFHYIRFPDDADTMRAIIDVHFPGIKQRLVSEALKLFTKSAPCEGGGLARASEPKAAVKPEHRAGISGRRR
jgi:MoxR-like ATPase